MTRSAQRPDNKGCQVGGAQNENVGILRIAAVKRVFYRSQNPFRADLAAELEACLHQTLLDRPAECRRRGEPAPARLPACEPLFNVPSGLTRIPNRDLHAAGIPNRDERDRVLDIHALRVTFCSHLCAAGVPLRTAQVLMRHSKPELTANIYSDPKLLDIVGAIESLPRLTNADVLIEQPA